MDQNTLIFNLPPLSCLRRSQHRPPAGAAKPDAHPGAGAEEAEPCAPITGPFGRSPIAGGCPPQPPGARARVTAACTASRTRRRRVSTGTARATAGLTVQHTLDTSDPHQLGSFIPPGPLLLRLLSIDDDHHHQLRSGASCYGTSTAGASRSAGTTPAGANGGAAGAS